MDWVRAHYTEQARIFGRAAITDAHRRVARLLHGWAEELPRCEGVLELGAGACGLAAALTELGHEVFAVEFNPVDLRLARELIEARDIRGLHVIGEDFYEVQLPRRFDLVYSWDGFGVGEDADQRRLLDRIGGEWLTGDGLAVLDVFSPWAWRRRDGEETVLRAPDGSAWRRRIEFDAGGRRFTDFVRPADRDAPVLSQTIRCYTPDELVALAAGTALRVDGISSMDGTRVDPGPPTPAVLRESNGFLARLVRR